MTTQSKNPDLTKRFRSYITYYWNRLLDGITPEQEEQWKTVLAELRSEFETMQSVDELEHFADKLNLLMKQIQVTS